MDDRCSSYVLYVESKLAECSLRMLTAHGGPMGHRRRLAQLGSVRCHSLRSRGHRPACPCLLRRRAGVFQSGACVTGNNFTRCPPSHANRDGGVSPPSAVLDGRRIELQLEQGRWCCKPNSQAVSVCSKIKLRVKSFGATQRFSESACHHCKMTVPSPGHSACIDRENSEHASICDSFLRMHGLVQTHHADLASESLL
ncbi:hypothetical protein BJV74DRAFT_79435 [Russula compacta]|nr:hypothetical protein BJV74DRAFT_79435 [Russula compacta]